MQFIKQLTVLSVVVGLLSSCSQSEQSAGSAIGVSAVSKTQGAGAARAIDVGEGNMTYAIQNSEGQHMGFLLMVGGETSGDCIFRSLPAESELFDSDGAKLLYEMQLLGEFSYLVAGDTVTFKHPQFSHQVLMTGGLLKAGDIEFRMERAKKSSPLT